MLNVNDITTAQAFIEEIYKELTISQARSVAAPGGTIDIGLYFLPFNQEQQEGLDWLGGYYADRAEGGAWLDKFADTPFGGEAWPVVFPSMWAEVKVVPIPAAVWLFGSGLLGLIGISRRKKAA